MSAAITQPGWCPFAVSRPTSKRWPGNAGRHAVVLHIADGDYAPSRDWLANATSNPNSSSHFIIDNQDTGSGYAEITQLVSINDSAWANGLSWDSHQGWIDPEGRVVSPPWSGITPGQNPNLSTISIERAGRPDDVPPAAQNASLVKLLRWLAGQFSTLNPYVPGKNLIGHCEISPIDRARCPGPHVDYAALVVAANVPLPAATAAAPLDYRAVVPCPVWTAPDWESPLARDGSGYASLNAGGVYAIGRIVGAWAWLYEPEPANSPGFVPMKVLERAP